MRGAYHGASARDYSVDAQRSALGGDFGKELSGMGVVGIAMRTALPEARPGVYLGLSLGVAFPFSLILALPLYALAAGAP
jgi:hypothetical protein